MDIIKDRQYTTKSNSHARKSAQTAMFHIAEALIRWITPILSFTAHEAWEHIPGNRNSSIFTQTWYDLDQFSSYGKISDGNWEGILETKEKISKELEELRNKKEIGSSLDAEVKIWNAPNYLNKIENDELRFVFITSYADLEEGAAPDTAKKLTNTDGEEYFVAVIKSSHQKCVRCWHHREDVGSENTHLELCARCVSNLPDGHGEERHYA